MRSYAAAWHYARFLDETYRRVLRPFRLTGRQGILIQALFDNDGLTQQELAAIVGMSATTVSQALRMLIESAYVIRRRNEDGNRLYLTEAARKIEPEFRKRVQYAEQNIQSAVFDFFPIQDAAKVS